MNTLFILLASIIILIALLIIIFHRNPKRNIPKEGIVSPADGIVKRVISVEKGKDKSLFLPKGMLGGIRLLTEEFKGDISVIQIVMTVFDMHHQKAPLSGTIEEIKYSKGKFLNAVDQAEEAMFLNERNSILIKSGEGFYAKIVQVAGIFARRIHCRVKEGQSVDKGEELGFISFGSQVLLVLPSNMNVKISEGERVKAGETIIASN